MNYGKLLQPRGFTVEFKSPSNGNIPAACRPYSHAVIGGDYVFLAGQTGRDPRTGKVIEGDIEPNAALFG
jgi:enamine deaminase RidA (YjgF/YER057c/UK114 family)